ncbi:MAG: ATP phosphoribosyltransferase regulatory subunit [Vulcanimicrobiaceae bacterium]
MRLPAGVRDWLPDELARKRSLESALRAVFEQFGYAEVQTPGFERFDVLAAGLGDALVEQTFRFNDRTGNQLVLRPEMTTPIARLVSTRMRDAAMPLRLSYVQPAYRYEEPQEGRMREFTQAGLELIGAGDADADAESLFSAIEALDAVGLGAARYDVNHAAIVEGVLTGFGYAEAALHRAKVLIGDRNLVGLRALIAERGGEHRDELVRLTLTRGTDEVLAAARKLCMTAAGRAGIERLSELLERARERGLGDRIAVDLSLLRDFAYYTGLIFEGFVGEVGFALVGGGRYDALLPRFGFPAAAVGWSVSIERLLIAHERQRAHA